MRPGEFFKNLTSSSDGKSRKRFFIPLVVSLLIVATVIIGYAGFEHYSAQKLEREGDAFFAAQQYDEALSKYTLASSKWSFPQTNQALQDKISKTQQLKESHDNFTQGVTLFNEGKWPEAKIFFEKVIHDDIHYAEALALANECQNKLNEVASTSEKEEIKNEGTKSDVAGVATVAKPSLSPNPTPPPAATSQTSVVPAVTSQPSTPAVVVSTPLPPPPVEATQTPVIPPPPPPASPSAIIATGTDGSFQVKDDAAICRENGKPIIYLFSTTWCPHCVWVRDMFDKVVNEYRALGKIIAYHWQLDTGDDTLTAGADGWIPSEAMNVYNIFNPVGYVPTYVFGCKYWRVGNFFENVNDLNAEENEFRRIIDKLL